MASKFICPVKNAKLTSDFGYRDIGRGREWHQGVDLASKTPGLKVPVYASASGKVSCAKVVGSYGNSVRIVHTIQGKTYETNYAHLDKMLVRYGDDVKQGQQIGIMGNTGGSFGVHLHFEIHNGRYAPGQPKAIDPMIFVNIKDDTVDEPKKDYSKQLGYNAPKDSKAYRIHTSSYKSKTEATKASKSLVENKVLRYAEVFGNDKDGYRIQSGKYDTQKDAEKVAVTLLEKKETSYVSIIGSQQ